MLAGVRRDFGTRGQVQECWLCCPSPSLSCHPARAAAGNCSSLLGFPVVPQFPSCKRGQQSCCQSHRIGSHTQRKTQCLGFPQNFPHCCPDVVLLRIFIDCTTWKSRICEATLLLRGSSVSFGLSFSLAHRDCSDPLKTLQIP